VSHFAEKSRISGKLAAKKIKNVKKLEINSYKNFTFLINFILKSSKKFLTNKKRMKIYKKENFPIFYLLIHRMTPHKHALTDDDDDFL